VLPPTRIRYRVVALAALLAAVTYFDRVCISILAPLITRDLKLSQLQMSFVFSAFTFAYAAFEIPSAWWADRIGARRVLTRIVAWWSTFTILTGAAFNYPSLLVVRWLFGAGEAGAWPTVARAFSRWIPATERGRAQGVFFMGAHLAGGITPLLVTGMLHLMPWRAVFVVFGAIGFVWTVVWYRWFRDDPEYHAQVNKAELERILQTRCHTARHHGWGALGRVLSDRNVLLLCAVYFANGYGFYFCITWLPTYLSKIRGFSAASLAVMAGLPLMMSVFGDVFGGIVTDWVTRRFGLRAGRAFLGGTAYLIAGVAMIAGTAAADPTTAAVLISVSTAASMFTLAAAWGTCLDIGGNNAAVVSAAMNTSGQVAGILSPILLAYIVDRFGSWNAPLYIVGILFLVGAGCWCAIDPRKPIFEK
jgi:ACS family glucarate transporter-like MFS transporter